MSNCAKCGGSLSNPFSFSSISSDTCQCNTGPLVTESNALPGQVCCVVSVNGKSGVVVLDINDIDLLGNEFFSPELVWQCLEATTPIKFDVDNGIISHALSGVVAGTYGSETEIPVFTVNNTGHITGVTLKSIGNVLLGANLEALGNVGGTGFAVRTAVNTWALRAFTGTAGRINVVNPSGIAGNPQFDLVVTAVTAGEYGGNMSWPKLTIDAYGRITHAETISMPSPTIPPHTHALGDLSNVDPTANTPNTGDALVWNGSEWVPSTSAINFSTSSITKEAILLAATSANDIDSVVGGTQINNLYRLADTAGRYKVSVNCIFYLLKSSLVGFPGSAVEDLFIGTLPTGYRPMHPTYITGPTMFQPVKAGLKNSGGTTAFAGKQILYNLTYLLDTDGKIYLTISGNSDFTCPTLGGVDNVILPLTCEFLTKLIVP